MGHLASLKYLWVWFIDFEFRDDAVVCLVARELKTGQTIRLWENELYDLKEAPFDVGASSCIVAYGVGAELSCFEKLGWKLPVNIIDLYPEFLNITNGCPFPDKKRDLLVALKWFGIKRISVEEKEAMRELILSKTSYTPEEKIMILDYCETDVIGLEELFPKIIQKEEFIRIFAEFRGRYSKAINKVSNRGIPMDEQTYKHLHANRPAFRKFLIEKFDTEFQIFENGVFKTNLFERYLVRHSIQDWPRTEKKHKPILNKNVLSLMAEKYPQIRTLSQLKATLNQFNKNDLLINADGRNVCYLGPFGTLTARNQPSTTEYIFGLARWNRFLIQAPRGRTLLYFDWGQQEYGIAAKLSGDLAMQKSYLENDPYISFAILAGYLPQGATQATHPKERELFKTTIGLGVLFAMSAWGLSKRLGISIWEAEGLLKAHKKLFPTFWRWSDAVVNSAFLEGSLHNLLGWHYHVTLNTKPRTLRNYLMQSNASAMMQVACCLLVEAGFDVNATLHDAFLIETDTSRVEETIAAVRQRMDKASSLLLGGFILRIDVKRFDHPNRFFEKRGLEIWRSACEFLKSKGYEVDHP